MSNEHYDEFCQATYPDLTLLERQLLGHYCARFNEKVSPPRAWPPLQELLNITGVHAKSISRSLGSLTRKGYLRRVTLASRERGRRAEYAPNRELIKSLIKVTEELPNVQDITHLQVTVNDSKSNPSEPSGNAQVANRSRDSYPKPKEPNKPNNVDRFYLIILNALPERLRTFTTSTYLERLLDECDDLGVSDEVRRMLTTNWWDNVKKNPRGLVISLIKKALERKRLGFPVIPSNAITPTPAPFVDEAREITPRTASTNAMIEDLRKSWGMTR
jgi:hypothetical protein